MPKLTSQRKRRVIRQSPRANKRLINRLRAFPSRLGHSLSHARLKEGPSCYPKHPKAKIPCPDVVVVMVMVLDV